MADSSPLGPRSVSLLARFNDYDEVQHWAVILLYIQVRGFPAFVFLLYGGG